MNDSVSKARKRMKNLEAASEQTWNEVQNEAFAAMQALQGKCCRCDRIAEGISWDGR